MSNWEITEEWKMLGGLISAGSAGYTGAQVRVMGAPEDLTDDEKYEFSKLATAANKLVCRAIAARDPKRKEYATKQRAELLGLFEQPIFVENLPNGYCSDWCCEHLPWFRVYTKIGAIEIGWRKRVMNIDWSKTVIKKTADELFPGENTTKYDRAIHAWSLEKAGEYIRVVIAAAGQP